VTVEHTIEFMEVHSQYFKCILAELKTNGNTMTTQSYFICGCILYNLLTTEHIPDDWAAKIKQVTK
jgi:hypothetical protein